MENIFNLNTIVFEVEFKHEYLSDQNLVVYLQAFTQVINFMHKPSMPTPKYKHQQIKVCNKHCKTSTAPAETNGRIPLGFSGSGSCGN